MCDARHMLLWELGPCRQALEMLLWAGCWLNGKYLEN